MSCHMYLIVIHCFNHSLSSFLFFGIEDIRWEGLSYLNSSIDNRVNLLHLFSFTLLSMIYHSLKLTKFIKIKSFNNLILMN